MSVNGGGGGGTPLTDEIRKKVFSTLPNLYGFIFINTTTTDTNNTDIIV